MFMYHEAMTLKKNQKGFTLLEILIALFVFTIVAMIMVSALHTALTIQTTTEKNARRFNHLQTTILLMSRDLEQTIDRSILNAGGTEEPALYGTNTEIKFTHAGLANPFWELNRSTLQRTHYFLRKNSLFRETWPVLDQTRHTQASHRLLLKEVTDLRFQYLDQHGKFQNAWPVPGQTEAGLPRAIRVLITTKNRGNISQLYVIAGQSLEPKT
jgi:general secretion pathway protein J